MSQMLKLITCFSVFSAGSDRVERQYAKIKANKFYQLEHIHIFQLTKGVFHACPGYKRLTPQ